MENVLLSLMDDIVLDVDLSLLLGPLKVQLLLVFLLFIQLDLLVIDPAGECLDLRLYVSKLVFGDLQISLGAQTHVRHLIQTGLVFLLDLTDLRLSVLGDLLHRLIIVPLHRFDVVAEVGNLLVFFGDSVLMVLLLLVHLLGVFLVDCSLGISKLSSFLLLLLLEGLVASCVFQHALRVLIPSCFKLLVVFLCLELQLLLELVFNLVLACLELLNFASDHQLLTGQLLVKLLDFIFLIVSTCFLADSSVTRVSCTGQIVDQLVSLAHDVVHL